MEECCICYMEMNKDTIFYEKNTKIYFDCNHCICLNCLDNIIQQNNYCYYSCKCPICRQDLVIKNKFIDLFYLISDDYNIFRNIKNYWYLNNLFKIKLCSNIVKKYIVLNNCNIIKSNHIDKIKHCYFLDSIHICTMNDFQNYIDRIKIDLYLHYTWRKDDKFKLILCMNIFNRYIKYYLKNRFKMKYYDFRNDILKMRINYQKDVTKIMLMYL